MAVSYLLQEVDSTDLLTEDGDDLLTEGSPFTSKTSYLLLETGDSLLSEDDVTLLLVEGQFWSSGGQTTWNQNGIPGLRDNVSIQEDSNVVVDVDTTAGDGSDQAIVVAPGGRLYVADGVTLTVVGVLDNSGSLEMGVGSSILYDFLPSTDPPFNLAAVCAQPPTHWIPSIVYQ